MILTKFKKRDFEKILANYSIGDYLSHKHIPMALENTVYLINTTKGKFILKIFEYAKIDQIYFQLKIMEFLKKRRIPVQKLFRAKNGKLILVYKHKRLIIHEFVDGQIQKKFSLSTLINVVQNLGKMNKALLSLKLKKTFFSWKEYQFVVLRKENLVFESFDLKRENSKLLKEYKEIDTKKLKRSIIHSDYHSNNILIKDNKVAAIIDFGDAREKFLIQEIITLICMGFNDGGYINRKNIPLLLEEYQKFIKLNEEEKKSIPLFVKNRMLGSIAWHIMQIRDHKDKEDHLIKEARNLIKSYYRLNKIDWEKLI